MGIGLEDAGRSLAALLLVTGLVLLLAWAARKLLPGLAAGRHKAERRLQMVEMLPLDQRHRLVIVKVDGREHAIVLSPASPVVLPAGPAPDEAQAKDGVTR